MAWSAAVQQVRTARALQEMPATREALADGGITRSALRVLVSARETNAEAFESAERILVDAARTLGIRDLRRAAAYWRQAADHAQGAREAERLHELRRLHVSPTLDGMVRVDGDLDPEIGQTFMAAVRCVLDTYARTSDTRDPRTSGHQRADALGYICRQWLDGAGRPVRRRRSSSRHGHGGPGGPRRATGHEV